MREVQVSVCWRGKSVSSSVRVEVEDETTCSQLAAQLVESLELDTRGGGAWRLVERWRGCERCLPRNTLFLESVREWGARGEDERFCLKYEVRDEGRKRHKRRKKIREKQNYFNGRITRRVYLLQRGLRKTSASLASEVSSILLGRLAEGRPLGGPGALSPLTPLRERLAELRKTNLKLSTEISDLNVTASQLTPQLASLQEKSHSLSAELQRVQKEVIVRQAKAEREARSGLADLQTEVIKLRRELETRNRLNSTQSSKLQAQKETLTKKRQLLSQKQQELARVKSEIARESHLKLHSDEVGSHDDRVIEETESHDNVRMLVHNKEETDEEEREGKQEREKGRERGRKEERKKEQQPSELHTSKQVPQSPPPSRSYAQTRVTEDSGSGSISSTPTGRVVHTPSSIRKRVFEARTRQLLEAEGEVFRRQLKMERQRREEGSGRKEDKPMEEGETGTVRDLVRKLEFSGQKEPPLPHKQSATATKKPDLPLPPELVREGERLLTVPQPDDLWYKGQGSPDISYREKLERVLGGRGGEEGMVGGVEGGMGTRGGEGRKGEPRRGSLQGNHHSKEQEGQGLRRWSSTGATDDFFSDVMATFERRHSMGSSSGSGHASRLVQQGKKRRVRFSPEAIILSAAMDGELETVRECVKKLGGCSQISHKGATCLHNAVCSGHLPTIQFLVEIGCDINAQDEDGWTPLHCAVAYSNHDAISYLLSKGASLFLKTQEGDSPLSLGHEELRAQREMVEGGDPAAAEQALLCLQEAHAQLGVANGGVVYALFHRRAVDFEELNLREGERLVILQRGEEGGGGGEEGGGEGWWRAENRRGERGVVPSNFLGISPQHRVML